MAHRPYPDRRPYDRKRRTCQTLGEAVAGRRTDSDGTDPRQPAAQHVPARFAADQQLLCRRELRRRNLLPPALQRQRQKKMGIFPAFRGTAHRQHHRQCDRSKVGIHRHDVVKCGKICGKAACRTCKKAFFVAAAA